MCECVHVHLCGSVFAYAYKPICAMRGKQKKKGSSDVV